MVSIGVTVSPTRKARKMTAISTEPKWSPTNRTALPGTTASAMSSGVSSARRSSTKAGVTLGLRATST